MSVTCRFLTAALLGVLFAAPARAQEGPGTRGSPFFGSVPTGAASAEPLPLSLKGAVARAFEYNLGLLLQEESARSAHGARWRALADLLPNVTASVSGRRQVLNLEAFGIPAPDPIVGPFNVFDARARVSQVLIDLRALHESRASSAEERAATLGIRSARELVVLVAVDLYLEVVAAESRVEVARAQQDTADALLRQASNLQNSGLAAGIDVVRADVQVQNQRQRRILADNAAAKARLKLARAIGLPPGQAFTLTDRMPYAPLESGSLEKALADAYARRPDYLAARARLEAAEEVQEAATANLLPTVGLDADYGTIGQEVSGAHPTYTIAANVRIPIFEGGRTKGKQLEAEAAARQRRVEYEDLRGRIDMDVRSAFLDLDAASQQLEAAKTTVSLANQELTQARDRFSAGVAGNLEVIQAQESVASASDIYVEALFAHNLAKAALARAVGTAESAIATFPGGVQ